MGRTENKQLEAADRSAQNAVAILHYCLDNGFSPNQAKAFGLISMEFSDFQWFFHKAEGDFRRLKDMIEGRLARVEANRKQTAPSQP
jgi:hypothetical protein